MLNELQLQIRNRLLDGQLILPSQFIELVGDEHEPIMRAMFQSLFHNYIKNKGSTSIPYWYEKFDDDKAFNAFLKHLSNSGWIITEVEPKRNWAEMRMNETKLLTFVSALELTNIRKAHKLDRYKLTAATKLAPDNLTKQGKKKVDTGLERAGFRKAGKTKFQYDIPMIKKYQSIIEQNLTKSMDKLALDYDLFIDGADYSSVSKAVLQHHIDNPDDVFTTGSNTNDSRGRAISDALGKIFNPISNKDARSLMVIPEDDCIPMTNDALPAIYLFISELLGYKPNTISEKEAMGKRAYEGGAKHIFDIEDEDDRADFHENIWLERIYNELDQYTYAKKAGLVFYWMIPIEVDATASLIQVEGALLGHEPFLRKTNCYGDTLEDMWTFPGIPRKQFKAAATPMLYASSKGCVDLWKSAKIKYTADQVKAYNKEILNGDLSVANAFKDFIVNNVKPREEMKIKIWEEEFTIQCNRYRQKGDYQVRYNAYDTKTGRVQTIYHTHTHKEADLEQFRRYFVTLLIHNLDSQVADNICLDQDWIIPIHDAFLINPCDAKSVKEDYASLITRLYQDREQILSDFFQSIGIDSKSATAWKTVKDRIIPVATDFVCQSSALK